MSLAFRRAAQVGTVAAIAVVIFAGVSEYVVHGQASGTTGGFIDSATSVGLRPMLSAAEMATFLPTRGTFTFLSPYLSQGIRLTNAGDCGGSDCVQPVGYSYWSNINNHAGNDVMLVFLGLNRQKGGGGPTLFSFDKRTGETKNLGPIFPSSSPYSWATGEGWYFSATQRNTLYLNDGPRIVRYDVIAKTASTVFDASGQFGSNRYIWQMHSSNDDRVHSATLRDSSTYEMLGCVVYSEASGSARFFAKKGDFDECQIDRSGRWLLIKENVDSANGEDNRIVDLQTGTEQLLTDPNGAAGHSDIGFGVMVAEDNFNREPGAVRLWNYSLDMQGGQPATIPDQGTLVYKLSSWSSGIGHIAFGNATTAPASQQRACVSNASRLALPRVNEIVCFQLDGSLTAMIVAPNLTDLNASGGGSEDYFKLPKGNLDVTGEYFIWTGNAGTNRLDAYMVRIPSGVISPFPPVPPPTPAPPTPPPPAPTPTPTPTPAPAPAPTPSSGVAVSWTNLVNVAASGSDLRKTGGCNGCADAGAISSQRIASGDGGVWFTTSDVQTLRFVGLGSGTTGTTAAEIAFALRLQAGRAEVREAGVYKAETTFAAGDVLKIAVEGGVVKYSKNGSVFYTSATRPAYPLRVDTAFYDLNGSISNVKIAGSGTSTTSQTGPESPGAGSAPPSSSGTALRSPRVRG